MLIIVFIQFLLLYLFMVTTSNLMEGLKHYSFADNAWNSFIFSLPILFLNLLGYILGKYILNI